MKFEIEIDREVIASHFLSLIEDYTYVELVSARDLLSAKKGDLHSLPCSRGLDVLEDLESMCQEATSIETY